MSLHCHAHGGDLENVCLPLMILEGVVASVRQEGSESSQVLQSTADFLTASVRVLQSRCAMQTRFSVSPPQTVIVTQEITTRFSIISSVIYMLSVAMSELKGQTALKHVLLLHHSSVFCKTNSLPNSVSFSPHLQELHVCGIYPSLMLFKCVTTTKFYYGFAPSSESIDV